MSSEYFCRIAVDWIKHDDYTTSFMIRRMNAGYDEDMGCYDMIIKDWETLK